MISFMRSRSFNADNHTRVKSVRILEYGALDSSIRIHPGIRMESTQYYSRHGDGRYTPVWIGYVNGDSFWLLTVSNTYGPFRTDRLPLLVTNDPSPKILVSDTLPIVRYSYTGTIDEVATLYRLSIGTATCDASYDYKAEDAAHQPAYKLHGSADGDYAEFVKIPKLDGSDYYNLKVIGVSDDNTHASSFNSLTESDAVYLSTHALHFTSTPAYIADVKFSAENTLLVKENKHIVGWNAENIAVYSTSIQVDPVEFTEFDTGSRVHGTFRYTSIDGVLPSSSVVVSTDRTITVSYINIIEPSTVLTFRSHADLNNGGLVRIVSEHGGAANPDRTQGSPNYTIGNGGILRFYNTITFTGDVAPIVYMDGPGVSMVILGDASYGKPANRRFMAFPDGGFGFRFWDNRLKSLSSTNFSVGMVITWCAFDRNRNNEYDSSYIVSPADSQWITLMCIGRALGNVGLVINSNKLFVGLVGGATQRATNYINLNINDHNHYYKTALCLETTEETIDGVGNAQTNIIYSVRSQKYAFSDDVAVGNPDELLDIECSFPKSDIVSYENLHNSSYLQTFSCVCNNSAASANDPVCVAESRLFIGVRSTLDSLFASIL